MKARIREATITLDQLKEILAHKLYGMSPLDAWKQGICIECKEQALPKCHSTAGKREYFISGLCEECFDRITVGGDAA